MTRLILFPSAYLPALGGVEEFTRHLALTLVAAGDDVEVWTGTDESTDDPSVETIDGLLVRRFPLPLPTSNLAALGHLPLGALRTLRAMGRARDQFRPDLLHVNCFGPNGVYAEALATISRLPVVLTLHGETVMDDHDIFERSTVMRSGLRVALRRAAAVTGCSQFTLTDAESRFGLRSGHGQVIFNGVDLAEAAPAAEPHPRLPTPTTPLTSPITTNRFVLAVGRLVEKKGFDLLLRAFALIAADHPDVNLVIAGDGAALSSLRDLASQIGLADRVLFPGRLSRVEVAATMARAEMVVMPSRVEPFGIVVLETWRAGRPIVATSHGGPREFVNDGHDGVLVDPFDTAALARSISDLLSDGARRQLLGTAGHRRVEAFDWPVVAGRYRTLYAQVSGRRSPRGPKP